MLAIFTFTYDMTTGECQSIGNIGLVEASQLLSKIATDTMVAQLKELAAKKETEKVLTNP
jgi:hypothetical protein